MSSDVFLKKNIHFNKIINEGDKIVSKCFFAYYMPSIFLNSDISLIGISVGKKIGKAHVRNFHKRRIRQIIRGNLSITNCQKKCVVIILRPLGIKKSYEELEKDYSKLIKEINEK